MKNQRKHYTPEEKVALRIRHLLDKEPISKLCDEPGLKPTVFALPNGAILGCAGGMTHRRECCR